MKTGFLNILTVIFVIAKLAGAISWSWWIVFAPTIVSVVLGLIVIGLALLIAAKG